MTRTVLIPILAAIATSLVSWAAAADPSACQLVRVTEWPVRLENGRAFVDGAINGKKVNILVHTGAYASLVVNAAAKSLDLHVTDRTNEVFADGRRVGVTRLDELRIGGSVGVDD